MPTYQYLANPTHIFELNATYIREHRDLNASVALGFAEKNMAAWMLSAIRSGYTFRQTYALSLAYAQTTGTRDAVYITPQILLMAVCQASQIARHLQPR